jgi:hypothetical protein
MQDGYFSDLSWLDWIGVVLFAPLLLALVTLLVYLTIGFIGSGARRRRVAKEAAAKREAPDKVKAKRTPGQAPGD